ncbi:glycosyltransferase family 2 protein [Marinobacter sediminum]|uniref:glycosyltransferase family 2 protein n=1 Tax=Marinobacter sediminum TaxID=256323 RepID=UPI00202EF311
MSIVTVCFNSVSTIEDTLDSVQSQSHGDIEHIIVDGGSSDGTLDVLESRRPSLGALISEPDEGLYDAMNKGIRIATGDIIGILNSDDFFESDDVVATVVDVFRESSECDLVFGDVVFVEAEDLSKVIRYYGARHFRPWKLRFGWMPPHPATFVRRRSYDLVGAYRVDMQISADFEMFVRWLMKSRLGWKHLDKVLVRMRSGGVSTSGVRSSITLNQEIVRACRENGIYTNLFMVLSKIPFKLFELLRRPG